MRCPRCKSKLWNVPYVEYECDRCGCRWEDRRADSGNTSCPRCRTELDSSHVSRYCACCDHVYSMVRSISMRCPVCRGPLKDVQSPKEVSEPSFTVHRVAEDGNPLDPRVLGILDSGMPEDVMVGRMMAELGVSQVDSMVIVGCDKGRNKLSMAISTGIPYGRIHRMQVRLESLRGGHRCRTTTSADPDSRIPILP